MVSIFDPRIHIFDDMDSWTQAAAHSLAERMARRLAKEDRFTLALTGGSTPKGVYHLLGQEPLRSQVDWDRVQIFFGDERSVGPDDPQSNYRMAREAWLGASPIPATAIHRMEGEAADLDAAATRYEATIRREVESTAEGIPRFDLILLGMGDDGHTASLFPGTKALDETERIVVPNDVPQLNTKRLTLTYPALNAAREIWFLVTGDTKAAPLVEVLNPFPKGPKLPSARVRPTRGELHWWLDRAAAAKLPS